MKINRKPLQNTEVETHVRSKTGAASFYLVAVGESLNSAIGTIIEDFHRAARVAALLLSILWTQAMAISATSYSEGTPVMVGTAEAPRTVRGFCARQSKEWNPRALCRVGQARRPSSPQESKKS